MRLTAALLAVHAMITIDQRDALRMDFDAPSASISADGRYVAFTTYVRYSSADVDDRSDVYVVDRVLTRITFESDGDDPAHGRFDASSPALSGDGGTLVYELDGRLIARDRATGTEAVIGTGRHPSISHDGTLVAFTSTGVVQPVTQTGGAQEHVRIYNRRDGSIRSIAGTTIIGGLPIRASVSPSISADGRRVAFTAIAATRSAANDAVVFIWDSQLGETRQVAAGWDPSISADGRYVAYVAARGQRSKTDVHVIAVDTGRVELISRNEKGQIANGRSGNPALSRDGRFIAFQSDASNLVSPGRAEDFNLLSDVFLFDRITGGMRRVSTDEHSCWMELSSGPAIDASASVVAFSSKHPTGPADTRADFDLYVAGTNQR